MFYATFNHIINFLIYSVSFADLIFNLLLCAKMYYVFFNHLIYILIYIIGITIGINSYCRFFIYVNFLPANLLVLVVIFMVDFTCRLD